jgi:site-specific recombinase XerD
MLSLERLTDSARGYMEQSKAPNTVRAYRADWADFEMWCEHQGLDVLPAAPETIALYLAALADAGAKASTIQRRLSSISQAHHLASVPRLGGALDLELVADYRPPFKTG